MYNTSALRHGSCRGQVEVWGRIVAQLVAARQRSSNSNHSSDVQTIRTTASPDPTRLGAGPSGPFIVSAGCVYPASWLKSTPGTWQIAEEQKGKSVGGVCTTPAPDLAPYFSISFSRVFAVSTWMIMPLHATRLNYRLVVGPTANAKAPDTRHQAPYISDTCLVCVTIMPQTSGLYYQLMRGLWMLSTRNVWDSCSESDGTTA